ncbi:MAG: ABC transporter permease subunit [Solirubrobacteraceae bacterium]|jgi:ABC-2 type transport system permease protein
MRAEVARLELANRRRLLAIYVVYAALYMLAIVLLYPTFRHSSGLDSLVSGKLWALAGVIGSLTSPAGWVNANAYTNLLPLAMLALTIGYGAGTIAGQDENGTLGLVVVLPLARDRILAQKIVAMVVQALVVTIAVAACVYVGAGFDLTLDAANVATASLAVFALGIDFGLIALAVGAATANRTTAIAVASALAGVSYLISSLARVVSAIAPLRFASLFYWSVGDNQIANGASLAAFAVLTAVAILAGLAAILAFRRLDVR